MKMLLVSNMYPSDADPQYATFVQNIKEALAASACMDVSIAVIRGRSRHRFEKIYKYLRFFLETTRQVLRGKYDLLYVHYPSHSYVPLLLLGPWRGGKLAVHVHGSDILREARVTRLYFLLKKFVSCRALQAADLIIVPSNYYRDVITTVFKVPPERVFVYSSGGVDLKVFCKLTIMPPEDTFRVGYVGRLERDKGVGTLVQAMDILQDALPNVQAVIIGKGTMEHELRQFVQNKGLAVRVAFPGAMQQSALVSFYNSMHVFVFPTERETESLGLVGLEAMACGIPVIGARIGGLRDYLKEGYNGFFFEPGSATDLASKILQFYHLDRQTKARLSEQAIATAQIYDASVENHRLMQKLAALAQ
jgi:glycosyltransferase involved in cell wall biosynthesis